MNISEFLIAAQGPRIGKKRVSPLAFLNHYRAWLLGFPGIRSKIETCFRWLDKPGLKQPNEHPTPLLQYIMGLISTEREIKPSKPEKEPKEAKTPKAPKSGKASPPKKEEKKSKKVYAIIISVKDDPYNKGKWELGIWGGNHRYEEPTEVKRMINKDTGMPEWKEVKSNFFAAETFQEAMGICDRKLDQNENSVFGTIIGHGKDIKVHRTDAIARIHKKEKGPSCVRVAKVSSKLGFGIRTRDYKQHYSHG